MPVPSKRLKELIEGTVDHHAAQHWPVLQEVTITWRGSYGYLPAGRGQYPEAFHVRVPRNAYDLRFSCWCTHPTRLASTELT